MKFIFGIGWDVERGGIPIGEAFSYLEGMEWAFFLARSLGRMLRISSERNRSSEKQPILTTFENEKVFIPHPQN